MARTRGEQARKEQERLAQMSRLDMERRQKRLRLLGVLGVLALLAVALAVALHGAAETPGTAVGAGLGRPTEDVPSPPTGQFKRVGRVLRAGSKPELLFIGAQYSPYSAAERWAVVKALGQFGTFSGLRTGESQSGQSGFQLLPTFDLLHARYRSAYVAFDHKDLEDRGGSPLQKLSREEAKLFDLYDPSRTIPLVLAGGYAMAGSGYSPGDIQGRSFDTIQKALQRGAPDGYVQEINAETNAITALLCRADGAVPRAACGRRSVREISRYLQ